MKVAQRHMMQNEIDFQLKLPRSSALWGSTLQTFLQLFYKQTNINEDSIIESRSSLTDFPKMLKQMDQILILILHSKCKFVWRKKHLRALRVHYVSLYL